jgi:hypothetical protein
VVRLSIIIPYTESTSLFEETLVSVLANQPEDSQVIATFPGCYDDPYDLASEMRIVEAASDARLADLLNAGIAVSSGPVMHVIMPGLCVSEGWTDPVLRWFESDPGLAMVSPLITDAAEQRVVAAGVSMQWGAHRHVVRAGQVIPPPRRLGNLRVDGPTLLAGFYRRDLVVKHGGFDGQFSDELCDLDLSLRLVKDGYRCRFAPACRLTSPATAWPADRNGFRRGITLAKLFRRHYGWHHPLAGVLLYAIRSGLSATGKLPRPSAVMELLGRVWGIFQPLHPTTPMRPSVRPVHRRQARNLELRLETEQTQMDRSLRRAS